MTDRRSLFRQVIRDLAQTPRRLPAKLFYDATGAALFEEITRLEEYYPTRTELSILRSCLGEVASRVGSGARVVEFGTGSGEKTSLLLEALPTPNQLVLLDISRDQLEKVARDFRAAYPGLEVTPLAADYTLPYRLPAWDGGARSSGRTLFFFPGSTLGNLEPHEAHGFLTNMAQAAGRDASLLLGVDRAKDPAILTPAYDDAEGVTAAFNRNALVHLNRVLGANFTPECFDHEAHWNPDASRIEMHLVSRGRQEVRIDPELEGEEPWSFEMAAGEAIVTEHSYKYERARLEGILRSSGWTLDARWTDEREWFDVLYLTR